MKQTRKNSPTASPPFRNYSNIIGNINKGTVSPSEALEILGHENTQSTIKTIVHCNSNDFHQTPITLNDNDMIINTSKK